jgi:hypothetical protein
MGDDNTQEVLSWLALRIIRSRPLSRLPTNPGGCRLITPTASRGRQACSSMASGSDVTAERPRLLAPSIGSQRRWAEGSRTAA